MVHHHGRAYTKITVSISVVLFLIQNSFVRWSSTPLEEIKNVITRLVVVEDYGLCISKGIQKDILNATATNIGTLEMLHSSKKFNEIFSNRIPHEGRIITNTTVTGTRTIMFSIYNRLIKFNSLVYMRSDTPFITLDMGYDTGEIEHIVLPKYIQQLFQKISCAELF